MRNRPEHRGIRLVLPLVLALARLVAFAATIVFAIIALGIVLRVVDANGANGVVSTVHDAGRWLVGPFDGMFTADSAKATLGLNWGIAAVLYLLVGRALARWIGAAAAGGRRRVLARRDRAQAPVA